MTSKEIKGQMFSLTGVNMDYATCILQHAVEGCAKDVELGAKKGCVDIFGNTPLHRAAFAIVFFLLRDENQDSLAKCRLHFIRLLAFADNEESLKKNRHGMDVSDILRTAGMFLRMDKATQIWELDSLALEASQTMQ